MSLLFVYVFIGLSCGIDCEFLYGQGYDGASNMSDEYNGLQAHIKEKNNHATFFWCHAHRLNLVVVAATSKVIDTLNLFGNL